MKTNVVLAGSYPAHTLEKLRLLLPEKKFNIIAADTQETFDAVTDAEIIILRILKAPREVMERNPKLKMILRWGAGFDSVDIKAAGERGVLVTNTPGANAGAVSELAVLLMLAVGRKLLCHAQCLSGGQWSKTAFTDSSYTLNGKLVGILGAGNIGRQVAEKVQAFGAAVQYYDPFPLTEEMEKKHRMARVSLKTLIATSDVISLHLPLTDENLHMIGADEIAAMKPGAILVNTARGGLVDDGALAEAVAGGRLLGAGLDVVESEPLSPKDPLLRDPRIVVTPHIGGGTADIGEVILPMLVQDILDFAGGREVQHVVNREYLSQQTPLYSISIPAPVSAPRLRCR